MNGKELTLFNAHTGSSVQTNRYYFVSLDELKKFCSNQFNIPFNQVFLISPFGIKLKSATIDEIDEIYLYDRGLFSHEQNDKGTGYLRRYLQTENVDNFDSLIQPINSPLLDIDLDYITKNRSSRQLVSLLTTNLGWVAAIESDSSLFTKKALDLKEKIHVLFRSSKVASQYIESYHTEARRNYDSSVEYALDLQKHSLNLNWKEHYERLTQLKQVDGKPLSSLLNERNLKTQSDKSIKLNESINSDFSGLRLKIDESREHRDDVDTELSKLEKEATKFLKSFDAAESLSELHLLSEQVQKDTRHLLDKTRNSVDDFDIDIILETFHRHKNEFVVKIYDSSYQLYKYLLALNQLYSKLQLNMVKFLQKLSASQAEMVVLRESLKTLSSKVEEIQTIESALAYTIDIPLLYGVYLIESLRRNQWLQDMKLLASKTNENFATLREKEVKLRTQWLKNYGVILTLLNYNISSSNSNSLISFELISNEDKSVLPEQIFVYEDCVAYIQELKSSSVSKEIVNLLLKSLEELPTKRPTMESVKGSSKPSKSDSDIIKGYKTRIRKLESLLHQEQFKSFSQKWPSSLSRTPSISRYSPAPFDGSKTSDYFDSERNSRSSSPPQQSEELTRLIIENRELSDSLKTSSSTIDKLNDEIKASRQILSVKEFETQNLSKKLESLGDEKNSEISKLQLSLTEEKMDKTKLEATINDQISKLKDLDKKLLEKDALIEDLKSEHSERQKELQVQIDNSKESNDLDQLLIELNGAKERIKELEEETSLKSKSFEETSKSMEEKIALIRDKDSLIEAKDGLIKDKDSLIEELNLKIQSTETTREESVNKLSLQIKELSITNEKLDVDLTTVKEDFQRLKSMKNDLLENMSNRENEFAKEKGAHQEEVESLRLKIDELDKIQQDQEDSQVSLTKQLQTIVQLVIIIDSLLIKCRDLSDILFNIYQLIEASLRSIGLLAVKSPEDGSVDIIRVKGLRKTTSELMSTADLSNGFRPVLESDIESFLVWSQTPDPNLITQLNTESEIDVHSLEMICESLIESYNLTTFEEKYLNFVNHVTNLNVLLVPSVSKRFREVEHLAKKELKENKRLKDNERNKISVRNFEIGDLVLFLPTRNLSEQSQQQNQWAAFNDMGDVKYLMKNELSLVPQRQWFIGRILNIENVGSKDFLITAEEVVLPS